MERRINLENVSKSTMPIFKYEIGYHYCNDGVYDFTIVDRGYYTKEAKRKNKAYIAKIKQYKIHCNNCEYELWRNESQIGSNKSCPVCGKLKKIIKFGVNDITTTDSWMVKYFLGGFDEASKYTRNSKKRVDMICPDCGRIHRNKSINGLFMNKKLSCPCQDSMSYPNKFLYSVFEQLGVSFEIEKKFDWSERKRYDDFIILENGKTLICENNGGWHYIENQYKGSRNLQQEKENDIYKKELALKNGIDYYVILDCRKSNKDWIQKQILNSQLNELFDLSIVDFEKCNEFAIKNFVKYTCEFYEKHKDMFLYQILNDLKISKTTLYRYLTIGNELGFCNYDPKKTLEKGLNIGRKTVLSPIYCFELDMYYCSIATFVKDYEKKNHIKLCKSNISAVCNGRKNSVNGMRFKHITKEEFNNIKLQNPEKAVGDLFENYILKTA